MSAKTLHKGFTVQPGEGGFIVVKDGCNAMPGACICKSVEQAIHCIDVFVEVNGDAELFWEIMQPFDYKIGQKMNYENGHVAKGRFSAVIENSRVVKLVTINRDGTRTTIEEWPRTQG